MKTINELTYYINKEKVDTYFNDIFPPSYHIGESTVNLFPIYSCFVGYNNILIYVGNMYDNLIFYVYKENPSFIESISETSAIKSIDDIKFNKKTKKMTFTKLGMFDLFCKNLSNSYIMIDSIEKQKEILNKVLAGTKPVNI